MFVLNIMLDDKHWSKSNMAAILNMATTGHAFVRAEQQRSHKIDVPNYFKCCVLVVFHVLNIM